MAKHYLEQVTGRVISSAGNSIMAVRVPVAGTLEKMTVYVAGNVSSTNTFDANLNGSTLFPTAGDRPSITSGNQSDEATPTNPTTVAVGDKLTVDADVVNENLQFVTVIFQIEDGENHAAKEIAQNSQSAAYTTVLGDAGKHIYHPSGDNNARTFTIDSNANVPYPIGTVLTFINEINTVTIAIASDTLVLAGTGSTGSRSLAANGMATAIKVGATRWIISGIGLS